MALPEPWPLQPIFEACRVRPGTFEGFGRGMCCTEKVSKGEEFLRIPLEKCWTAEVARACPELQELGEELLEAISDASLIALHILVVRAKGSADVCRKEHLALLESAEFDTLLDWPAEDLEMLAGSKWAMVAKACREDIEEEFVELEELLESFLQSNNITSEKFYWAHRLLISRSMQIFNEDGSMLYLLGPGQDMFNHSVDVPLDFDDVGLVTCAETGKRSLAIRAYRDFEAGEQAFYSYSGASNGRLLLMAGFVIPDNPFDNVELACGFPVTAASLPLFYQLAESLEAGKRTPGSAAAEETKSEFIETLPHDAEEPKEVMLHVRLGGPGLEGQLERVLAFFRLTHLCRGGHAPTAAELAEADKEVKRRVEAARQLRGQLQQMLKGYASSLDQDQSALPRAEAAAAAGDRKAQRQATCLRVLLAEKRIFASALEHLDGICASASSS